MNQKYKILLAAFVITTVFTHDRVCAHFGFGQAKMHGELIQKKPYKTATLKSKLVNVNQSDTLYCWNERQNDWVICNETVNSELFFNEEEFDNNPLQEPINIEWNRLNKIYYKLKYFKDLDLNMYAPIFSEAVKKLDGKEVIIEGFVIPFDEKAGLFALSLNPYASCFFCGKASPASVISMYIEDKSERLKVDEFKKFKGTLHLNEDDPNEFYYILRNAKPL